MIEGERGIKKNNQDWRIVGAWVFRDKKVAHVLQRHPCRWVETCRTDSASYLPRRVAKYGARRSKSSVPKVNAWFFVVAEDTQKLPRSRMACCCRAHAHVPVVGVAVEDVRWSGIWHLAQDVLRCWGGEGEGHELQSVGATRRTFTGSGG